MSELTFKAIIKPESIDVSKVSFTWSLKIDFEKDQGYTPPKDSKKAKREKFPIHEKTESAQSTWKPLDSFFAGGTVTVNVIATLDHDRATDKKVFVIKGENPTKSKVLEKLGNDPWFIRVNLFFS